MSKEWEDDNDNDDDFDINDDAEVDEHETDLRPMGKGAVHRRRIELLKEKLWLKEQLDDYPDWQY